MKSIFQEKYIKYKFCLVACNQRIDRLWKSRFSPLPLFSKPLFAFTAFLNFRSPLFKKTSKEILIELNQLVFKYRSFSRIFAPKRLRFFERMFPLAEKKIFRQYPCQGSQKVRWKRSSVCFLDNLTKNEVSCWFWQLARISNSSSALQHFYVWIIAFLKMSRAFLPLLQKSFPFRLFQLVYRFFPAASA